MKQVSRDGCPQPLAKQDFIPSILSISIQTLCEAASSLVDKYLDGNPDLTVESVTRASTACGPLYKWAESQTPITSNRYAEVAQPEEDAKIVTEIGAIAGRGC
jgi:dynein heavy chain 1